MWYMITSESQQYFKDFVALQGLAKEYLNNHNGEARHIMAPKTF